jgi:hypothetical protein
MVIKMQRGEGWEFIGDIKDAIVLPHGENEANNGQFFDEFRLEVIEPEETHPQRTSAYILAHRSDGKTLGIVSERDVYLLNDNGKTIERLN